MRNEGRDYPAILTLIFLNKRLGSGAGLTYVKLIMKKLDASVFVKQYAGVSLSIIIKFRSL